ncbi:MAG TPA: hypothetical protein VGW75_18690 [Solirubrobacteraceae bacterium]|jgi:hypothetical protein|nr:hypothetical protein [Solirubrobacteraceae bacterium]
MRFARGCLSGVLPGLALLAATAPVAAAEGWRAAEQHGPTAVWSGTPQGSDYLGPTAAVGVRGDALLAWERAYLTAGGDCCLYEMQFVERPPGGAWGPVRNLPGTDGELDFRRDAAIAANGAAVVGFVTRHDLSGDAQDTRVSVRSPDGTWGAPVTLASGGWQSAPHVAIDDDGRPTAVWQEGSHRVMTSTGGPAGWSAPVVAVAVPPEQYIQRVLLAGDGHGNLVLGLTIYDSRIEYENSGATAAFVATRSAQGAWSEPAQLGAWTDGYIQTVATNRRGDAALAWSDGRATHLVRRPAGAAFGPSEPLSVDRPWNSSPRLALAEDGHLTAVTRSSSSSPLRIWAEVTSGPIDGAMEGERVGDDERRLSSALVVALREGGAVLLGEGDAPTRTSSWTMSARSCARTEAPPSPRWGTRSASRASRAPNGPRSATGRITPSRRGPCASPSRAAGTPPRCTAPGTTPRLPLRRAAARPRPRLRAAAPPAAAPPRAAARRAAAR